MPIPLTCECGQAFSFPDQHAGKGFKCKGCGKMLVIPKPAAAAAPAPVPMASELAAPAVAVSAPVAPAPAPAPPTPAVAAPAPPVAAPPAFAPMAVAATPTPGIRFTVSGLLGVLGIIFWIVGLAGFNSAKVGYSETVFQQIAAITVFNHERLIGMCWMLMGTMVLCTGLLRRQS